MAAIDAMGAEEFQRALAPLFEGAPGFIARLAADRPFGTYDQLLARASVVARTMPDTEQVALIDAHPRIGAPPASVSPLSFREQGYDREPPRTGSADAEAARQQLAIDLERLNDEYEARFGFRFVIFVAGRPRAEIARVMEASLSGEREAEKERALADIVAIAGDRVPRMASPVEEAP